MEQNIDTGASMAPTADNKQKGGNGLKIATAIACVVAACGIGFGVYGIVQSLQKDNQISDLKIQIKGNDGDITTIETDKIEVNEGSSTITISDSISDGDNEVKAIVEKISNTFDCYMGNTHFVKTFNEFMPRWKIAGTDIFVDMEKSYGIYSGTWMHNKETENKLFSVHEAVEAFLEDNGYVRNNGPSPLPIYYNEKTQIVCELDEGSEPWDLGCAKTNWVSEDRKQLAIELTEASGSSYLNLSSAEIIDSSIAPYQRLIAGGFAAHLFYRVSPNDGWRFITATQDLVGCDKFNDDAKKAYAGEKCWDSATNTEKTL